MRRRKACLVIAISEKKILQNRELFCGIQSITRMRGWFHIVCAIARHKVGRPVLRESSLTALVLRKEIMVVPLAKTP